MCARIAVDIDSTLYDFCGLARGIMGASPDPRLRNAAYAEWSEWRTPMDIAGDAWLDVVASCHAPHVIRVQRPFHGATTALWDLHDRGHQLVYASNRNASTQAPTEEWLRKNGFPHPGNSEVDVRCHTEDKLGMVVDCQYLIDDRPRTLVGFAAQEDRKAFGLVTPYNRALTDIPGIYLAPTWPLLSRYLSEKIGE